MPAGCFRQCLFLVNEPESFSVRFNKGFVYNFINSSFASPTSSTESDLIKDMEALKNPLNSLLLNPFVNLYCSLPITGKAVGPILISPFRVFVVCTPKKGLTGFGTGYIKRFGFESTNIDFL